MTNIVTTLSGYKTYITAGVAIIGAIAGYLTGTVNLVDGIGAVIAALGLIFLRNGSKTDAAKAAATVVASNPNPTQASGPMPTSSLQAIGAAEPTVQSHIKC